MKARIGFAILGFWAGSGFGLMDAWLSLRGHVPDGLLIPLWTFGPTAFIMGLGVTAYYVTFPPKTSKE